MKAQVFEYQGEGIECVYNNGNWVMCIKNWKPNNDIGEIKYLEVHHETDEQFVLVHGKAVLLTASRENDSFQIDLTLMVPGKIYNVPKETWFNTITQKDTKLIYVQDAGTTEMNSTYCDMTQKELETVRERAAVLLCK